MFYYSRCYNFVKYISVDILTIINVNLTYRSIDLRRKTRALWPNSWESSIPNRSVVPKLFQRMPNEDKAGSSSSANDFQWELNMENVKPVRRGRRADALSEVYFSS